MSFASLVNAFRPGYAGHVCHIARYGQKKKRFWIQPRDPIGRWTDAGARAPATTRAPRAAAKKPKTALKQGPFQAFWAYLDSWKRFIERGLVNILFWYVGLPAFLCGLLIIGTYYAGYVENYAAKAAIQERVMQMKLNGVASFAAPAPRVHKPAAKARSANAKAKRTKKHNG